MMDVENYHIQVYLLSIQHKKSTPLQACCFVSNDPKSRLLHVFELKPGVKSTPKK